LSGQLHSDEETTDGHDDGPQESFADLPLSKKDLGPQDREDGAQLEDGSHIANQAECDGSEPKERGHACNERGKREGAMMGVQPVPPVPISVCSCSANLPKRAWREEQNQQKDPKQGDNRTTWWSHMVNGEFFQDRRRAPQVRGANGKQQGGPTPQQDEDQEMDPNQ